MALPPPKLPRRDKDAESQQSSLGSGVMCGGSLPNPLRKYVSLQEMLAVLERHGVRGRVVVVPGDHCCWLWGVGVCSGELADDTFVRTPCPRERLTPGAISLIVWMHAQRKRVSDWLKTPVGVAVVEGWPMDAIRVLYRCGERSRVADRVLVETEWGRSIHFHGLAQVACALLTSSASLTPSLPTHTLGLAGDGEGHCHHRLPGFG